MMYFFEEHERSLELSQEEYHFLVYMEQHAHEFSPSFQKQVRDTIFQRYDTKRIQSLVMDQLERLHFIHPSIIILDESVIHNIYQKALRWGNLWCEYNIEKRHVMYGLGDWMIEVMERECGEIPNELHPWGYSRFEENSVERKIDRFLQDILNVDYPSDSHAYFVLPLPLIEMIKQGMKETVESGIQVFLKPTLERKKGEVKK